MHGQECMSLKQVRPLPIFFISNFNFTLAENFSHFVLDEYAVKLNYSELASSLKKLHSTNKGSYDPDPLYSTYHYSHPPLLERLRAITAAEAKRK
jgi:STE24 endopeptidase